MGISIIFRPIGQTPDHSLWEWRVELGKTVCTGITYSRQSAAKTAEEVARVIEDNFLEAVI